MNVRSAGYDDEHGGPPWTTQRESAAGPVGAVVGAIAPGLAGAGASVAAVAAVDRVDDDNVVTGLGDDTRGVVEAEDVNVVLSQEGTGQEGNEAAETARLLEEISAVTSAINARLLRMSLLAENTAEQLREVRQALQER